ncbi:PREDICTED: protein-lysine N-methyltransferase mettl10 [Nicrophorus vespilloides]|uniref:Protein-lysine N-methyltransferase LOC108556645 n=1 Tax=Nicrophorus vespilloides TaxID=110193 RepID=A0ABM1M180_NICVS|nr:PREDICTED: protein-lysine N-methyltransferase mettl10 [Nicrophorus vespilloides]
MEELGESELGTQEYWDKRYKHEVKNFRTHGDVGEVWFGDDIVVRILRWFEKNVDPSQSILDLGCGNGMLLIDLYREGFKNLKGVDYCQGAITLAKEIAGKEEFDIAFDTLDITADCSGICDIDVVLDKGTYDAISLSLEAKENRLKYIKNVCKFMKDNGLFIITSCNWTQEELCEQFEDAFVYYKHIPTPQFKFGGKVGSVVSSVVFKKIVN